mmetsp:Transcript_10998/g.32950  ORF Transcript_10998/g.32950 Transcript_10998/m.32950 type:complete len:224 (+) Transcript_10998:337-1008(+)
MHVEGSAHTVAGAVPVIQPRGPQGAPRQRVQSQPWSAWRKHGRVQGDVSLQHAGEARLLVRRGLAKVHGACDVGGAHVVLPAAVDEQVGVFGHCGAGGFRGAVMNDGPIGPLTSNGGEAAVHKARLGLAAGSEVAVHLHLRHRRPPRHLVVEPLQELHDGHSVTQVSLPHARQLCLVLDALPQRYRAARLQHRLSWRLILRLPLLSAAGGCVQGGFGDGQAHL